MQNMAPMFDCVKETICQNASYVSALIGVGGTLLGTILGWLLARLSVKGKITFFVRSWEDFFGRPDSYGSSARCHDMNSTEYYCYTLKVDIYNTSSEQKIMRDIRILFDEGTETFVSVPTVKSIDSSCLDRQIGSLNIEPKRLVEVTFSGGMHKGNHTLTHIWNTKKVYLQYKGSGKRTHKVLIKEEDYANYFKNHNEEETDNG